MKYYCEQKNCYNGRGIPIFTDLEKSTAHIDKDDYKCENHDQSDRHVGSRKEELVCGMSECFTTEIIVKMKAKMPEKY